MTLKKGSKNQMEFLFPDNELERTQDFESLFHDAGQFYWGRTRSWIMNEKMHSSGYGFEVESNKIIDIDNIEDWRLAEAIYKKNIGNKL